VREAGMLVPPAFPLRLEVWGPNNQMLHEFRKETNEEGACEFEVDLPSYIRTGRYTAKAFVGKKNEIGRTAFNVEEFMPDRIKVKIETDTLVYNLGDVVDAQVEAVNLFGPPAAGRRTELKFTMEARLFSPSEWRSFVFQDPNKKFEKEEKHVGEANLDRDGRHTFSVGLPVDLKPPSALRGILTATVHEPGGRAVTAHHDVDIHAYSHYVGLPGGDSWRGSCDTLSIGEL